MVKHYINVGDKNYFNLNVVKFNLRFAFLFLLLGYYVLEVTREEKKNNIKSNDISPI